MKFILPFKRFWNKQWMFGNELKKKKMALKDRKENKIFLQSNNFFFFPEKRNVNPTSPYPQGCSQWVLHPVWLNTWYCPGPSATISKTARLQPERLNLGIFCILWLQPQASDVFPVCQVYSLISPCILYCGVLVWKEPRWDWAGSEVSLGAACPAHLREMFWSQPVQFYRNKCLQEVFRCTGRFSVCATKYHYIPL